MQYNFEWDPKKAQANVIKETLNNCHFERSEKSITLTHKDSSLCSE